MTPHFFKKAGGNRQSRLPLKQLLTSLLLVLGIASGVYAITKKRDRREEKGEKGEKRSAPQTRVLIPLLDVRLFYIW